MIVTTERGRFAAHRMGDDGPATVLLHPLALAGAVWEPATRGLGGRVVAPDARGHGASDWDGRDFTVADLAADAASIIETLDLAPANVVGLSMGGSSAIVLAATRPELVHRIVLADTTACYGPDREEKWAERARNAAGVPRERQLEFQVDRWFAEEFRARRPDEVARVSEIFLATDSQAHAAACRALGGLDATTLLAQVKAPALVLAGEEDYATPPTMARDIAAGVPDAVLRVLPATRHLSLIERPELWSDIAEHLGTTWDGGA